MVPTVSARCLDSKGKVRIYCVNVMSRSPIISLQKNFPHFLKYTEFLRSFMSIFRGFSDFVYENIKLCLEKVA